jgi:hypothetical protein
MPRWGGAGGWGTAAFWIATGAVVAFIVVFALNLDVIVPGIYRDADYASTPVIAQLFGERGSGDVTLGNYPWLESLYVLRFTRWLPDHRQAWEALPFIGYALTILVFAWTLLRSVSARAAAVGALALACPAPLVLGLLGAPANRLPTLAHAVLLAAFLITLPGLGGRSARLLWLWAAALAISLAPGVASDPLLVLWGVLPFVAAIAAGRWIGAFDRWEALLGSAAGIAGALAGPVVVVIAAHHGIHKAPFPIHLTPPGDWPSHAWDVLRSVAQFLHGQFMLDLADDDWLAAAVSAMAAIATFGFPLLCLAVLFRLRGVVVESERPAAQKLLLVFWSTAVVGTVAAVVITDIAVGISTVRYLLIAWPAALALAMISWPRSSPAIVAVLAAACAAIGIVQLDRGQYDNQGIGPSDEEIAGLERFVERNGLDHGYAGYWDAAPVTYLSDFRARTYPLAACGPPARGFCKFNLHTMDSWYQPKPGTRTFFVYDMRDLPVNPGPPPRRWGRPLARARDGSLRLYAYPYDIAAVLKETSGAGSSSLRRGARAATSAGP